MRAIALSVLALILLAACGDTERPLRSLVAAGEGPDEFLVIPQRPLQTPPTQALPQPTPGGENRADPDPNADAIAALGGSASAQRAGGIPANDAALIAATTRFGVQANVRSQLRTELDTYLDNRRRLNVFNPLQRDKYFPAFAREALDASAEAARLRELGVAVPVRPAAQAASGLQQRPVRQSCVFTTAGPTNELRRVCTPINADDQ